jgi:hypothetical protein
VGLETTGHLPHEKLVLLSMADRADEDFRCWPSIRRLMSDTCIPRKETVIKAIRVLEALGIIQVYRESGKGSSYRLVGVVGRETGTENRTVPY